MTENKTPKKGKVAAKELESARRKRRHAIVMRNRIIFALILLAIVCLIIFGLVKLISGHISKWDEADTSTITFVDDGSLVFEEITDFDEDTYDAAELKSYIKDLVASYNEAAGDDTIVLNKVSVSSDEAYVRTTYSNYEDYTAFTSYVTYYGSVEDAITAGYDFEASFASVADGVKGDITEVEAEDDFADYRVAIVKENVDVVVPGTIYYISNNSTDVIGTNTVTIAQADGNEDATDLVYIIFKEDEE